MKRHILVFDSGLGGTTVLGEIQKQLPECTFSYAMDNGAFPYGNKPNHFLLERLSSLCTPLIDQAAPDIIVLACNTASTLALDRLRSLYPIPFVGVVPAIKPAATQSTTKVICLLATEATVGREYIRQLNDAFASHCEVIPMGSQALVEIAEQKILGDPVQPTMLAHAMEPLLNHALANRIDTFVLGCTHFPAIREELAYIWPHPVNWIDSGEAIARRVSHLCKTLPATGKMASPALYLTKPDRRYGASGNCHPLFHAFGIRESRLIDMA